MDDTHAEDLDARITSLCKRLDNFKEARTNFIKWALVLILTVWVSVLGYVYRIDVQVVKHTGNSESIIDRVDSSFANMEHRIEGLVTRAEKRHDRLQYRVDQLEAQDSKDP